MQGAGRSWQVCMQTRKTTPPDLEAVSPAAGCGDGGGLLAGTASEKNLKRSMCSFGLP